MSTHLYSSIHGPASFKEVSPRPADSVGGIAAICAIKPARTLFLVVLFATAPLFIPRLQHRLGIKGQSYRQMLPNPRALISFKGKRAAGTTLGPGVSSSEPPESSPEDPIDESDPCVAQLISDPTHSLDHFYASLSRTDAQQAQAITRISHYGDSPITNDGITGTTRRLLQERFGDAGHGFILIDRPWAWYGHQAITFTASGEWLTDSFMNPNVRDGAFGLGGVSFRANGPGRVTRFAPAPDGSTGRNFSRLEVYYLMQPGGGQFSVQVNDAEARTVETAGVVKSGFFEIQAGTADRNGANSFEVKTISGNVRLFGAVLENDRAGVVYDSLGVNGAFAGLLETVMNQQHWTEQLQHRHPDLVVLNYGTNESEYASDVQMARYEKELREVVRRVHAALPGSSILIISPMDRGKHAPGNQVITLEAIPRIVAMQQRVARESGCAMGGRGTMARWHAGKKHLVGADLTHPNADGAATVGVLIYQALVDGYANYRARVSDKLQFVASDKKETRRK